MGDASTKCGLKGDLHEISARHCVRRLDTFTGYTTPGPLLLAISAHRALVPIAAVQYQPSQDNLICFGAASLAGRGFGIQNTAPGMRPSGAA